LIVRIDYKVCFVDI